jgi:hypothetical protein
MILSVGTTIRQEARTELSEEQRKKETKSTEKEFKNK